MRKRKLPHIEEIVDQRIAAGIAGQAEFQLYLKGDLEDAAYSDEFKQQLLKELAEAKPCTSRYGAKRQKKPESNR